MSLAVADVWKLLLIHELATPDEVRGLEQDFAQQVADPTSLRACLDWLLQSKILTPYQVVGLTGDERRPLRVGAYHLLERYNTGRLAGIFRARHFSLKFPVLLKVVKPAGSPGEIQTQLIRFQREARISAQLNHPFVVRTYQIGNIAGTYFQALENLQGQSLLELLDANSVMDLGESTLGLAIWDLARGQPQVEVVCRLMREAALGLAHLHEQDVVHRDVSPRNLWVTEGGHIKVLDFSLARDGLTELDLPQADLLVAGDNEFLGSPDYLSTEQAFDSQKATPLSDIYSLGCTLYHALTGRVPFSAPTASKQMLLHARQQAAPPSEFNDEVPPELDAVVRKMMAKEPADRYLSMEHVAEALEPFMHSADHVLDEHPTTAQLEAFLQWLNDQGPISPEPIRSPDELPD